MGKQALSSVSNKGSMKTALLHDSLEITVIITA